VNFGEAHGGLANAVRGKHGVSQTKYFSRKMRL
jgi:hypothetical protein